jgi:hypothetical protein
MHRDESEVCFLVMLPAVITMDGDALMIAPMNRDRLRQQTTVA